MVNQSATVAETPERAVGPLGLVALALLLTAVAAAGRAGHDYVQFHAAAGLVARGVSPYPIAVQVAEQGRVWERAGRLSEGDKRPDFIPYYYPPWAALACVPLTALGLTAAEAVWTFLGFLALVASVAVLLGGNPSLTAVALGVLFVPAYLSVYLGQTTPLILLGMVAAARGLDSGRNVAAGLALALVMSKPQLGVVAVPAALVWAARRGRWGAPAAFAAGLAALLAVGTAAVPRWLPELIAATREVPVCTTDDPATGVVWLSVLRAAGLRGGMLAVLATTGAALAVGTALLAAWDHRRPALDVLALGVLAGFFVAPYTLTYDLGVLLLPALALRTKLPGTADGLLVAGAVAADLAVALVLAGARPVTLFWMPAALGFLWTGTGWAGCDVMPVPGGGLHGGRRGLRSPR